MISGGWYNVLPKEDLQRDTFHESSVVSGAFYIKLLEIANFYVVSLTLQQYMMCQHFIKDSVYGDYFYDVPIKENHLYLFPSWLEHGSRVNNTDEDRINSKFQYVRCGKEMLPPDFVQQIWGGK